MRMTTCWPWQTKSQRKSPGTPAIRVWLRPRRASAPLPTPGHGRRCQLGGRSPADGPELALPIGRVMAQDEAALTALYGHLSGHQVYAIALRLTRHGATQEPGS